MDEASGLLAYKGQDAMAEKEITNELYGPLKALSEREAEKWFPGKTTIIRPGLIVGPGDTSDRFTYWPVRIDRGGEVLAPGSPSDPVQFIDARDLSEWTIRIVEQGTRGIFNATGPRSALTMAEMLYGIRAVTSGSNDIRFTWADSRFLEELKVEAWMDMPVWVGDSPENAGFSRVSIERALSRGLTFRPLADTARDTLVWFKSLPQERRAKMGAGLREDREKSVLAAWHAKPKPA
jgi:2'-hydroxyisoflavone reductase